MENHPSYSVSHSRGSLNLRAKRAFSQNVNENFGGCILYMHLSYEQADTLIVDKTLPNADTLLGPIKCTTVFTLPAKLKRCKVLSTS